MDKFMVVCEFKKGTVMSDVYDVVAEEQAKAADFRRLGNSDRFIWRRSRGERCSSRPSLRPSTRRRRSLSHCRWRSGGTSTCSRYRLLASRGPDHECVH